MRIAELINHTDFTAVLARIEHFYGASKNADLQKLYDLLRTLPPNENKHGMTLYIWVYADKKYGGIERIKGYAENTDTHQPQELHFDVYGLEDSYDDDLVYSIVSTRYRNFLGYDVEGFMFEHFSKESLLAHFLWELCRDGFDENKAS